MELDADMFGAMVRAVRDNDRSRDRNVGTICALLYNGLYRPSPEDRAVAETFFPWIAEDADTNADDEPNDEAENSELTRKLTTIFGDPTHG